MNTIITTVIGLLAGIFKQIIFSAMEKSQQKHDMFMAQAGLALKDRNRARKMKGVSFTRRFIAICFTLALVVAPTIYAFTHPDASIAIPLINHEGSWLAMLLPWVDPIENVTYTEIPVMAFTIQLYDMFGLIIGFYFGSGGSK